MNSKHIRLWDLPTRLFHWLLVLAVIGAVVSGQLGGNLIVWHGRLGLFIIGLLVFRIVWGLIGSTYARFAHFFPTPARLRAYLGGEWRQPGHNPLGALSVFALLTVVGFQAVSGLFSNDDIAFVGPLFDLVDKSLSNRLTGLHHLMANLLYVLVGLHVAAIVFYVRVKKNNMLRPMLTGSKEVEHGEDARGGGLLALTVAVLLALAAVYGASGAWLPEPPPPPAAEDIPAW
ncbi:cytochrome b/b6 domain-containing protein [Azonexus sp.]|uniref:cytochrome b/b6 domain-containing protein n=1 Tax=Azonexus sp. TaxID=1872668 RepID=UPI002827EB88|nr:cytochrome b/b6 domain-containing protein [Azonexus sp.]MDR1996428.1 cytochrome b/b6 domain-containing protein [Azonexus sp.]